MAEIAVEVQTFDEWGNGHFAQARYYVGGFDDVYWCDSLDDALRAVRDQLVREFHGEFDD